MSDAEEIDFEIVTNVRMLAPPPALRHEPITLKDWKTTSGKKARFLVWELTAADHADWIESGRVYTKDGVFKRFDNKDNDIRFLAYVLRDPHGNRLWHTVETAKAVLGSIGRSDIEALLEVANKMNSAKDGATEGNSEEI
jgi:hypothetical protein